MNRALTRISLALALGASFIGATMSPALADGDPYYSNGINPSGVRTPVPAPIPVSRRGSRLVLPRRLRRRLRRHRRRSTCSAPTMPDVISPAPWQSDSFEPSFTGGVGVGYVWGPYFRTDLTVDVHSLMNTELDGDQSPATIRSIAGRQDEVHVDDPAGQRLLRHSHRHAWTPYLGGGVGFAVNQLTRNLYYSDSVTDDIRLGRQPDDRRAVRRARPWSACRTISLPSSPST